MKICIFLLLVTLLVYLIFCVIFNVCWRNNLIILKMVPDAILSYPPPPLGFKNPYLVGLSYGYENEKKINQTRGKGFVDFKAMPDF